MLGLVAFFGQQKSAGHQIQVFGTVKGCQTAQETLEFRAAQLDSSLANFAF